MSHQQVDDSRDGSNPHLVHVDVGSLGYDVGVAEEVETAVVVKTGEVG